MSESFVVVVDFPGIKQFVFGTDRLVEIRGASALLDELNRGMYSMDIKPKFERSDCVFSGGGAGQFIVEGSRETICDVFGSFRGKVYRRSGGALRFLFGLASLEKDYDLALKRAFFELDKSKRYYSFELFPSMTHCGFIRECQSCAGMAVCTSTYAEEERILCSACLNKEAAGKRRGLWRGFTTFLSQHGIDSTKALNCRPDNFVKIGECCQAKQGYTALVYGDGNAMGALVKKIKTKEQYALFSSAVDESVRQACHEALWKHCKLVEGTLPADILLLGGDDVMVYLAAHCALPFAITLARLFEKITRKKLLDNDTDGFFRDTLGDRGLTLSIGIAYGKSHTPISMMVDQAEELLKSAKARGASIADDGRYTPACIDFHLTSRFNQVSVAESRKHHLMAKTSRDEMIRLFRGPYTLDEAEVLLNYARRLKQSGIPSSRLHRLGQAPFLNKVEGHIETLSLYGRCRTSGHHSNRGIDPQKLAIKEPLEYFGCLDPMPWRQGEGHIDTVLVDLVDIAVFIDKEGDSNEPSYQA